MEMIKNNLPTLNLDFILTHGKKISSQEAMSDVTPINWSDDVLNGKYKGKAIIKSKDEEVE